MTRFRAMLLLCDVLFAWQSVAIAQQDNTQHAAVLDTLINTQRNFDSGRANSPGTRLSVTEVSRTRSQPVVVSYQFYAKGSPQEGTYRLFIFPVGASEPTDMQLVGDALKIESSGRLVDASGKAVTFMVPDPAPGEPLRLLLLSVEGQVRTFASVVPNAIKAQDKGCSVDIVRLTSDFDAAFVEGRGFTANSKLEVAWSVGSALPERHFVTVGKDGYFDAALLIPLKLPTDAAVLIRVTSDECHPSASFRL